MEISVTGIQSVNSLDYIQKAFSILNSKGSFVSLLAPGSKGLKDGLVISQTLEVDVVTGWYQGGAYQPIIDDTLAQISYTSGTEGVPKGVMISHASLANTAERLVEIMSMDDSIREYIGVPVNYSFGFGRCRAVSSIGGEFFLPSDGFNPLEISQMLANGDINAVSAVPSLWRLLLESPELFVETGSRVRWIEIGSQYMSLDEKKKLRELFPNAKIVQHYGLTEASRTTFLDVQGVQERHLGSVGKAYHGVEVSIKDNGCIKVRGPHTAKSLLVEGKVESAVDESGWLLTKDGGHIIDGFLYFDGRQDDVINLGGAKFSPDLLETSVCKSLGVEQGGIVIFKTSHEAFGEQINVALLRHSGLDGEVVCNVLQESIREYGAVTGKNFPVHLVDEFPVTNTGKVKRKELTALFEKSSPGEPADMPERGLVGDSALKDRVVSIWENVLNVGSISPQDGFFDVGGDSLSAIRVSLRMEKEGLPKELCRKVFQGWSIERLLASLESGEKSDSSEVKPTPTPSDEVIGELIQIWQDVLKIEGVTEEDSFFDLGGDSLSAIRVVVRMESAGIPKEICRKIFEGHNIGEIVQSSSAKSVGMLTNADSAQKNELIKIWQDVLKIDKVTENDSFFDLGGDSLSAIRVVVRMESAGIPKEICRKIFEGHNIGEIVQSSSAKSVEKLTNADSAQKNELIKIWQDVLKIDKVTENDSFFDLGGDSLSAIRVVVRMESAGIPKESCRKIFEGHTINSLVNEVGVSNEPFVNEKRGVSNELSRKETVGSNRVKRTPISSANLSLNVIRGLLVLMNIAAHWMPGIIVRLPLSFSEVNKFLAPVYSSGTPGFAMVFGAGISFFVLPRFKKDKGSVNKLCVRNAVLLGVGIILLACTIVSARFFRGDALSPVDVSNAFYSVLFYYFFAVISIPIWLRLLTWKGNYIASCLYLSSTFYGCHLLIDGLDISPSTNPLIQTGILILTPKYNYLEMSAAVIFGAAMGRWLYDMVIEKRNQEPLLVMGLLLIVMSVIISFETGEYVSWFVWPKGLYLWTWSFYMGWILLGFFYFYRYIERYDIDTHPYTGFVLKLISVIGVMAFPLFIGHELVRPFAVLLEAFSVPGSLFISMSLFFAYSYFVLSKLYRLYYVTD